MKAAVIGLAAGVLTAVTPFELAALWPFATLAILWKHISQARVERSLKPLFPVLIAATVGVLVLVGAGFAPYKWEDTTRCPLSAPCASLAEVAKSTHSRLPAQVDGNSRVCFSSSAPSMREVRKVLEREAQLKVSYGYCGTGVTVLFGLHPIGGPRLSLK